MAKKTKVGKRLTKATEISFEVPQEAIVIESMDDAIAALEQMDAISDQIAVAQQRTVELKKNVTAWAVENDVGVIQLGTRYYRQIRRSNYSWNALKLKKIVKGLKTPDGSSLWNSVTTRVPSPDKINIAVKQGWISEKKIKKTFEKTEQNPFLQGFDGEAIDG